MTRPSITRAALVLVALAGCGGSVPEDSRVHEADPVTLSAGTLPAAPAGEDTAAPRLLPPAPSEPIAQLALPPTEPAAPVEGVPITVRAGENLVGIASVAGHGTTGNTSAQVPGPTGPGTRGKPVLSANPGRNLQWS